MMERRLSRQSSSKLGDWNNAIHLIVFGFIATILSLAILLMFTGANNPYLRSLVKIFGYIGLAGIVTSIVGAILIGIHDFIIVRKR